MRAYDALNLVLKTLETLILLSTFVKDVAISRMFRDFAHFEQWLCFIHRFAIHILFLSLLFIYFFLTLYRQNYIMQLHFICNYSYCYRNVTTIHKDYLSDDKK